MANALEIYRVALTARLLDERLHLLAKAGKTGFHPSALASETVVVAVASAIEATDWTFPTPREHVVALLRGVSVAEYTAHVFGASTDILLGHGAPGTYASRARRIGSSAPQVAQHLTHATGFAFALRAKKTGECVLAFMPETAAEAGDFHTALNFAGVTKAPIVFACLTDGSEAPAPAVEVADKAVAYGISRAVVDAGDLRLVADAVRDAAAKARDGAGPTLLELRLRSTPDPLLVMRRALEAEGLHDELADFALRRELHAAIEEAVVQAVDAGAPALSTLVQHVFAEVPTHLAEQLHERAALEVAK